jgi:hypothetical protein
MASAAQTLLRSGAALAIVVSAVAVDASIVVVDADRRSGRLRECARVLRWLRQAMRITTEQEKAA